MNTKIVMALLAVALLLVSIQLVQAKSSQGRRSGADDDAYQTIVTRTSVRAYTDAPVESEKIEKLLRAGMAAPSAVNKQPWHFIVVTDKAVLRDRKSTRLNSSHANISYAVFCLKKKKQLVLFLYI